MNRINKSTFERAKEDASEILLGSMIEFLLENGVPKDQIMSKVKRHLSGAHKRSSKKSFALLSRTYEGMGTVLSTWFDSPDFLNCDGTPAPITLEHGQRSLRALLKKSKVRILHADAIELLKRSPSVAFEGNHKISALRRVFVLSDFDVTRAAIVIPRFIETLLSNSFAYRTGTVKMFERQCSASKVRLESCVPLLRNIKEQGTAFVDSIDSQLEELASAKRRRGAEIGLVVFAWTRSDELSRPSKRRRVQ